jgi:hypothetical protein
MWYNAGTVTATLNNATVTGAGTLFLANVRVGDGITIAGSTVIHEVTNVASNTQLTISPVYPGTTGATKAYAVIPVQGYVKDLADQAKQLILTFSTVGSSVSVNALAGITGAADKIPYFTSGSTMWTTPLTLMARGLLDDPDAASMRATLGLKTAATATLVGDVYAGGVMERGYNSNGEWVRYANGNIHQWGYIIFGQGPILTTISANIIFPTLFYDNTYTISLTPQVSNNGAGSQSCIGEYYANGAYLNKATDYCGVGMYTYRYAQTSQVVLQWHAIGRWQAK